MLVYLSREFPGPKDPKEVACLNVCLLWLG